MQYIIFDLEATCWDNDRSKVSEIIEIGAVKLDSDLKTVDVFSSFVKPIINPELSDFCTKLTSIKQEDVNKAKSFDVVTKELENLKQLYELKEGEVVQVAQGQRNFYKLEREMSAPQKYEYNIKYSAEFRPVWVREHKELTKKGVDMKDLARFDEETKKNIEKWKKAGRQMKPILNEGIAMSIRDDKAILIALIKSNTLLLIKDISFVKLMKELFSKYYENTDST